MTIAAWIGHAHRLLSARTRRVVVVVATAGFERAWHDLPQLKPSVQTGLMIDLLESLKALLWEEWDPIGVGGIDSNWPNDEYDGYAFEVWKMLKRGSNASDIEEYLAGMETGHIGLSNNSGRAGLVAKSAIALKVTLDP